MLRSKGLLAGTALIAFAVVAALALLAGCGGGGDDETSSAADAVAAKEGADGGAGNGGGGEGGAASPAGGEGGGEEAANGASAEAGGEGSAAAGESAGGGSAGGGGGNSAGAAGGAGKAGLNSSAAKGRSSKKRGARQRGSSTGGASGSDAEFYAAADAICKEKRENTRKNLLDYTEKGLENIAEDATAIVDKLVIPNLEEELRDIRALNPPASVSGVAGELYGWIEKMIAAAKAEPSNFLLNVGIVAESEEAAKQNGFAVCGGI
jgi:hypothetical protein